MSYKAGRDAVCEGLRDEISSNIKRDSVDKVDVHNIFTTCSLYPGGLEELLGDIQYYEGNSFAMRKLLAFVAGVNLSDE